MPDKDFTSVYGQLQGYGRIIGTVGADAKESVFDPIGCLLADPWLVFCRCMFQCAGPVWNGALYDLDPMRDFAVCVGMDEFLEGEI